MPLVDFNDPILWEQNYAVPLREDNGVVLHYNRSVLFDSYEPLARAYIEKLGLTSNSKVLIVGAGYGWSQEWLLQLLPGITVVSTDISAKIHADKGLIETPELEAAMALAGIVAGSERWNKVLSKVDKHKQPKALTTVHNEDVNDGSARNRLTSAAGLKGKQKFDWGITEDTLTWLTDAEALTQDDSVRQISTNVCHFVTPYVGQPQPWNWKTGPQWKTLLPNSTIMVQSTYEVF